MFSALLRGKGHKAHMGDENKMVYSEKLKRWVVPGKEDEIEEEITPPPPMAATDGGVLQKTINKGDPSSRYVVAGGIGRSSAPSTDDKKSLTMPPALASIPTKPGGFFVPQTVQTAPEATAPGSPAPEKYKGFRIPKFEKPEGWNGTQEEYKAHELQKWKGRIDKKLGKKHSDSKTPRSVGTSNGIQTSPKTAKLASDWPMETSENLFSNEMSFMSQVPDPHQTVNDIFGQDSNFEAFVPSAPDPEGDPFAAFRTEENETRSQNTTAPFLNASLESHIQSNHQNETANALYESQPVSYPNAEPIDFDSWGNQNSMPSEMNIASIPFETQEIPEMSISQQPEISFSQQPELSFSQQVASDEPEYPGMIRDSDDPFDSAWATFFLSEDPIKCIELTKYMCQTYNEEWRRWHKNDPMWDNFWEWYYDGGDAVVHSSEQPLFTQEVPLSSTIPNDTDDAAFFLNGGFEETQFSTVHSTGTTENVVKEETEVKEQQSFQEEIPEGTKTIQAVEKSASLEPFVPEEDEDFWGKAADEAEPVPMEFTTETPIVEAVVESAVPPFLPSETICPLSTGKESIKLSSWEDETLFSIPDALWMAEAVSDEETDVSRLPFAIFSHEGILEFLQNLDSFLEELKGFEQINSHPSLSFFYSKVKELIQFVQMSKEGHPNEKMDENSDLSRLRLALEETTGELESFKSLRNEEEMRWQEQWHLKEQEASQAQDMLSSLKMRVEEQASEMSLLREKLQQAESEWETDKQKLKITLEELETKDLEIQNFLRQNEEIGASTKNLKCEMETLQNETSILKSEDSELFEEQVQKGTQFASEISESLRNQLMTLQEKLLEQQRALEGKDEEISRLTGSQTNDVKLQHETMEDDMVQTLKRKEADIEELQGYLEDKKSNIEDLQKCLEGTHSKIEELQECLKDKEYEIAELQVSLKDKDSKIDDLENEILSKRAELVEVRSQLFGKTADAENNSDLASEIEVMQVKVKRLEMELQDKDVDFQRLNGMLEGLHKKDQLISKLTAFLGEKDQELQSCRSLIEEGRQRETDLIATVAAKDTDLENVVHSLLFSQKQVSHLSDHCSNLGADPNEILALLQIAE